jgi:hypothetical protein
MNERAAFLERGMELKSHLPTAEVGTVAVIRHKWHAGMLQALAAAVAARSPVDPSGCDGEARLTAADSVAEVVLDFAEHYGRNILEPDGGGQ